MQFPLVLRKAIKEEHSSNRNFAKRLGVTEGRVSQLLSGAEAVSPYTLDLILKCFDDPLTREILHARWVSTYAPSPLEIPRDVSDEALYRFISETDSLKSSGNARKLLTTLEALLPTTSNQFLRFSILEESISVLLFLQRISKALMLIDQLLEEAKAADDKPWIATALYLRANASRAMNPKNPQFILRCFDEASSYARAYAAESRTCQLLVDSLARDRALTMIAIGKGKTVDDSILDNATRRLDAGIRQTEDVPYRLLWLEVKVRLLLFRGNVFEAEETLEEVASLQCVSPADFSAKEQISRASLMIARGDLEEAESLLKRLLEECLAIENLHQAGRVDRLLSHILAARLMV